MDVLDKFFIKYSYKFPKGYPDVKDPKDKKMLFNIVTELVESKQFWEVFNFFTPICFFKIF